MAERSLRGMSIGAKSLESDENVDFAARNDVAYICPKGHRTILPFAEEAEVPDEWECRCGAVAHREGDEDAEANEITKPTPPCPLPTSLSVTSPEVLEHLWGHSQSSSAASYKGMLSVSWLLDPSQAQKLT